VENEILAGVKAANYLTPCTIVTVKRVSRHCGEVENILGDGDGPFDNALQAFSEAVDEGRVEGEDCQVRDRRQLWLMLFEPALKPATPGD